MVGTIIFGIIGFGIMVFIHELGHFIAARLSGIDVEIFSLGWGKKLIGFEYQGTTYQISWFPLGGYCKMKGDERLRELSEQDQDEYPQEEGAFYSATAARRIAVIAAGPVANLVFAFVVLSATWWIGFTEHAAENRIVLAGEYLPGSEGAEFPATEAGLQTGDRIVAIDGEPVQNFQEIREIVVTSPETRLTLDILRDDRSLSLSVTPSFDPDMLTGRIGVYPWIEPIVDRVSRSSPAERAGLQSGDRIIQVGAQDVRHSIDILFGLSSVEGPVTVAFERQGFRNTTELIRFGDPQADLGISFPRYPYRSPPLNIVQAAAMGAKEAVATLQMMVHGIQLLFKGANVRNAVAGPLRITYYVGAVASSGFQYGLGEGLTAAFRFISQISIVLFLMSLIPIPALDGGHIALTAIELMRGRRLSPRIVYRIQAFGFSFLLVLILYVTFSDIMFLAGE